MDKKNLENHIKALKFNSKQEYGAWCKVHKINAKINEKNKEDFARELRIREYDWQRDLALGLKSEKSYENQIIQSKVQLIVSEIYKKYNDKDSQEVEAFIRKVLNKTIGIKLIAGAEEGVDNWLVNCWRYREFWHNSVDSFDCVYSNKEKIFCNLSKHLFFKFNIALFWAKALSNSKEEALWAIEYAQGKSLKELTKFSYELSNREVGVLSQFRVMNYNTSFKEDLHFLLFKNWTGNELIAQIASQSVLSEGRALAIDKEFWEQFFLLFRAQMFNSLELRGLIDFLYQQKSAEQAENRNFSLKNRSLTNLLQLSHHWHQKKKEEKLKVSFTRTFDKKWENWEIDLSDHEKNKWMVGQIYTEKDLYLEGETMHHCVYSYLNSCLTGACQIFSLRQNGIRVATLELRGKNLVQARKKRNAHLSLEEQLVVEEWAKHNKISISSF